MTKIGLWLAALSLVAACSQSPGDPSFKTTSASVSAASAASTKLDRDQLGPCADVLPAAPIQVASRAIVPVCETQQDHPLYLVGYSPDDLRAVWAAYTIDRNTAEANARSKVTRKNDGKSFSRTSVIPDNLQPTTSDYANNGRNLQRGHLAPAAAFKFNLGAYHSTFKVTNIAPQDGDMNRDLWGFLEESIAVNWAKNWDLLFVKCWGLRDRRRNSNWQGLAPYHGAAQFFRHCLSSGQQGSSRTRSPEQ
jgi:DNA/RNA endonuclease G (NUC1)